MSTYQQRPWSTSIILLLFLLVAACTTQASPEARPPVSTEPTPSAQLDQPVKGISTEEELEDLLREVVSGELKDVIFDHEGEAGTLLVCWNLQGAFSNDIIAKTAQEDTVNILGTVVESGVEYDQVHISGWYPMTIDINNTLQDTEVISLYYNKATLEERNWDTIRAQYIWWIADRGFVNKELQR